MKRRILISLCVNAVLCILITLMLVVGVMYKEQLETVQIYVKNEATTLARILKISDTDHITTLASINTSSRITLVGKTGEVLYDSTRPFSGMNNHSNRPEIRDAMRNGAGQSLRHSETLRTTSFYYAVELEDGTFLRICGTTSTILASIASCLPTLAVAAVFMIIIAYFISKWHVKKIITPLNDINLDYPLSNDIYEELSPLLRRIEAQNQKLKRHMAEIAEQQGEFSAVIESMNEGLVLLDIGGEILSVNQSAVKTLGRVGDDFVGKHYKQLNRNLLLDDIIQNAIAGASAEGILKQQDKEYQLLSSPVWNEGIVRAVVLIIIDITQKSQAEQLRREFSANVSHELKTPLTTISGFAEMLREGMVKPEDVNDFAGKIYDEAQRLIDLISDVIRLSRLDERHLSEQKAEIDIWVLIEDIADRYKDKAKEASVDIVLEGTNLSLKCIPSVVEEVLSNLFDNAIKYNKAGGSVNVSLTSSDKDATIAVKDSGIGIPKKHLPRIFERFYRVDKSHSKQSGGTGLGLSIVKNGVQYHGGSYSIKSKQGVGTTVVITLPR